MHMWVSVRLLNSDLAQTTSGRKDTNVLAFVIKLQRGQGCSQVRTTGSIDFSVTNIFFLSRSLLLLVYQYHSRIFHSYTRLTITISGNIQASYVSTSASKRSWKCLRSNAQAKHSGVGLGSLTVSPKVLSSGSMKALTKITHLKLVTNLFWEKWGRNYMSGRFMYFMYN